MILKMWEADYSSDAPVYLQLADYIGEMISSNYLAHGYRLPSQRDLSERHNISRNTVIMALDVLTKRGYLTAEQRSGYYVSYHDDAKPDWNGYLKRAHFRAGVDEYKLWAEKGGLRDFAISSDFDMSPYYKEAMIRAADRLADIKDHHKYGLTSLRESVATHLATHGIQCAADNILICPSVDLTIYSICASLMSGGANLLHEEANLLNNVSNIHSLGLNLIPVKMDDNGISPRHLEAALIKSKFPVLHVDTSDQAPTGVTMTRSRLAELMHLINKYRVPTIETDHMRDAWWGKPFPKPLKAHDVNSNVINIGTIIRGHPINMQMSWVVADRFYIEYLHNVIMQLSAKVSLLGQLIADEMFRSGMYGALMEGVRSFIRERREMAFHLCRKYLSNKVELAERNCGFHFWMKLNGVKTNQIKVFDAAPNYYPGYFFDKTDSSHILLCPASLTRPQLESAIQEIASLT